MYSIAVGPAVPAAWRCFISFRPAQPALRGFTLCPVRLVASTVRTRTPTHPPADLAYDPPHAGFTGKTIHDARPLRGRNVVPPPGIGEIRADSQRQALPVVE